MKMPLKLFSQSAAGWLIADAFRECALRRRYDGDYEAAAAPRDACRFSLLLFKARWPDSH